MKAEKEMHVEDDSMGGQQTNIFIEMQKEERAIQQQARNRQMMKTEDSATASHTVKHEMHCWMCENDVTGRRWP